MIRASILGCLLGGAGLGLLASVDWRIAVGVSLILIGRTLSR